MENKLDSILNDPEKMKAAFEMASKIMGQNAPASPPSVDTDAVSDTLQKMKQSGALDQLLGSLSSAKAEDNAESKEADGGKKGGIADILPNILQMMGGSAAIDSNRANLLKAIKPYVNEERSGSIDRAVNMAGMAKSAKNAIKGFKR